MTNATILHMRVEWFAEHYPGEPFHAILCDPPYHLTSVTKRFGTPDSAPARASRSGFMGKRWDGGDVAFRPETWAGLAKHLHPGGFGMAFASSRGWHRLAVAIEDAGLIIHPSIFGWAFGTGFPKATRIDTQVDRDAGAERETVEGPYIAPDGKPRTGGRLDGEYKSTDYGTYQGLERTAPATDLARTWQGHRYGLQALKPALEPIIVFQKPYQGRPVDNITATGAGALNIDGARIATGDDLNGGGYSKGFKGSTFLKYGGKREYEQPAGRWPSNLLLLDDGAAAALDAQSGDSTSSDRVRRNKASIGYHGSDVQFQTSGFSDSGGASRFFYRVRAALDAADPVCYTAKASRAEREAGLDTRKATKPVFGAAGDAYRSLSDSKTFRVNRHPTVKPLDLARYLATLLLPPDEYAPRRILVPFAGSGSECIGAFMAGWDEIVGVEFIREYVDIARARLAYWMGQGAQLDFMEGLTA